MRMWGARRKMGAVKLDEAGIALVRAGARADDRELQLVRLAPRVARPEYFGMVRGLPRM